MKKLLIIILVLLGFSTASIELKAQHSIYTQYMFNGLVINPAYAGTHNNISVSFMNRMQWTGIEGAPTFQSLSIHSPIPNKRASTGLSMTRETFGITSISDVIISYAYRIPLFKGSLGLGLQGGYLSYSQNTDFLELSEDQAFSDNFNATNPIFGMGLYYQDQQKYLGISIPYLMEGEQYSSSLLGKATTSKDLIISTGYIFDLNYFTKIKPNLLLIKGSNKTVLHINSNVMLYDKVWVGLSYRTNGSLGFLLDLQVNDRLKVGYSHDEAIGENSVVFGGSHEIFINYILKRRRSKAVVPRYF